VSFTPAANTTYYIRVSGYNGAAGAFNVRASGGTAVATVPTSPASPTVTRSGSTSIVRWTDRSTNETLFRIERQQRIGGTWTNTVQFTVGSNVTSYTDPVGAGRWRWRVRAENAAGASAWTAYVQQTVN
jgi:titin